MTELRPTPITAEEAQEIARRLDARARAEWALLKETEARMAASMGFRVERPRAPDLPHPSGLNRAQRRALARRG